jgi:hypothetical protein
MTTLFYDEMQEIQATLTDCRATNPCEPALCRRIDNAVELCREVTRKLDFKPQPMIPIPPELADDRKEMLQLFKASSEIAVEAMRRARFIESALTTRLEGWRVQAEYAPDSQARQLLRAKIEEVERILANARA